MVDTSSGSDDEAKAKIKEAVAVLPARGARTAATIQVDEVLANTVAEVLARRAARTS